MCLEVKRLKEPRWLKNDGKSALTKLFTRERLQHLQTTEAVKFKTQRKSPLEIIESLKDHV